MKTAALLALAVSSASAFAPTQSSSSKTVSVSATREEILSTPIGPETGGKVFDPLGLSELGSDETISWFRHAEIKHGRVAMAAFVGWWVTGAGLRFPGELAHGVSFSDIPSKGLEAWDAVPGWGKAQMLLFAGLIEFHDELFFSRRGTHYMRGGTPGKVRIRIRMCVLTGLDAMESFFFNMRDMVSDSIYTFSPLTEHGSWTFRSLESLRGQIRRSQGQGPHFRDQERTSRYDWCRRNVLCCHYPRIGSSST